MITKVLGWLFDTGWGKSAAGITGLFVLVSAFAMDQRGIGGERALNQLQRKEGAANAIADRAAARSGARGVQSGDRKRILDPSTRND